MRGRAKCNATASDVPEDESNYQHGAGAYLGDLRQSWGYVHAKDLIWDRFEVLERVPWMEGASCNCWPTWFGGSNWLSQQVVQDSKYSSRQSNFQRKSTSYERETIAISIIWMFSTWSDIWGRVRNLWFETKLILPIRGTVLRKTWRYPYIVRQEITDIAKLFKMVHCSSRSKFWRLSLAKISKFFHGGIWRKIFWEINYWGI